MTMAIIVTRDNGTVDVKATAARYIEQGEPRSLLLHELKAHVEVICHGFSVGQVDTQVQLLANAVFVNSKKIFHAYKHMEANHA